MRRSDLDQAGGPEREPGDCDDGSEHADHQRPGERSQVTAELTAQLYGTCGRPADHRHVRFA
jgi:hypothetical protein